VPDETFDLMTIGVDIGENDATTFIACGFNDKRHNMQVVDQY
jgi:hypothetical protein